MNSMDVNLVQSVDLVEILSEIGGFWKTMSAIFGALIFYLLDRALNKKLEKMGTLPASYAR